MPCTVRRMTVAGYNRICNGRFHQAMSDVPPTGMTARIFLDSDLVHGFLHSKVAVVSASVALLMIFAGVLAPWIAPHDPTDLATLSLLDSFKPPWPAEGADWFNPLGTDSQGRDVLS